MTTPTAQHGRRSPSSVVPRYTPPSRTRTTDGLPLTPAEIELRQLVNDLAIATIELDKTGTLTGFSYLGNRKVESWRGGPFNFRCLIDLEAPDALALLRLAITKIQGHA